MKGQENEKSNVNISIGLEHYSPTTETYAVVDSMIAGSISSCVPTFVVSGVANATGLRQASGTPEVPTIIADGRVGDDPFAWGRNIRRNINIGNIRRKLSNG